MFQNKKYYKYRHIIYLIGLPVLISVFFLLITNYYYFLKSFNDAKKYYGIVMRQMADSCEERINMVLQGAGFLVKDENVCEAMNGSVPPAENQANIVKAFYNYKETYSIVSDVFIMNPDKEYAVTTGGNEPLKTFLEKTVCYKDYSLSYWKSPMLWGQTKVLSPTECTSNGVKKTVIPVIFRQADGRKSANILIINIRFDPLVMEQGESYPENGALKTSSIYMLNRFTGEVYGNENEVILGNIRDTELYNNLIGGKTSFECEIPKIGKAAVNAYSTSSKLLGYTYFLVTPLSRLKKTETSTVIFSFIIIAAFFFISGAASLMGTKKLLRPFSKIINMSNGEENGKTDILEAVENAVGELVGERAKLNYMLPYAREKYLIDYLNGNGGEDSMTGEIAESLVPFRYKYFSIVLLQIYPTNIFFDTYAEQEYANIRAGLREVIKELFAEKFDVFIMSGSKESFYVILNCSGGEGESGSEEERKEILKRIFACLEADMQYVDIFFGAGGFHQGLSGLKKSYKEAAVSVELLAKPKNDIKYNSKVYKDNFVLSSRDESLLFNEIAGGNINGATERIRQIVSEKQNIDEKSKKQMLVRILSVVLRVMAVKGIDCGGKMEYEIYDEISGKAAESVYRKILVLLEMFPEKMERRTSKSESDRIIEYINENYNNPDLSRDMIADIFKVQPNYLSTFIKNELGINFKDYLMNIRIAKAKELLCEDGGDIRDIYEKVGFGSKQTFYRTFKNVVGMTPNEYRRKEGK